MTTNDNTGVRENPNLRELTEKELELACAGSLFGDILGVAWSAGKWLYHKVNPAS